MKKLLIAIAFLLILVGVYVSQALPSYSWHQKMTIAVEADGEIYTGSSVIRIRWRKNDALGSVNGPAWIASERGEAPVVEVPGHGVLIALLNPPGYYTYTTDIAFKVFFRDLPGNSFAKRLEALEGKTGLSAVLSRDQYPFLVTFGDTSDPMSMREVDPSNVAGTFGRGVRLKSVTLEITDQPMTVGRIESILDWLTWSREKLLALGGGTNPIRIQNDSPRGYMIVGRTKFRRGQ